MYYPDLSAFNLDKLKSLFQTTRVLPSQRILQENVEERFDSLEEQGIHNLEQLRLALTTKADVEIFALNTGLPQDYLTILRREVNSYLPKPINLAEFPGVNPEAVKKLAGMGIRNTKQLFD